MKKQLNQAHIELKDGARRGQDKVTLDRGGNVEWLNVHSNKPGAKFDLKVTDQFGNTVIEKKGNTGEGKRFGERISLPLTDSYYNVEVDNVEGADQLDVFLD